MKDREPTPAVWPNRGERIFMPLSDVAAREIDSGIRQGAYICAPVLLTTGLREYGSGIHAKSPNSALHADVFLLGAYTFRDVRLGGGLR